MEGSSDHSPNVSPGDGNHEGSVKRRRTKPSPIPDAPREDEFAIESLEPDRGASFPVVGIGASAGGLEAFTQLLGALPVDTGMAFVLVQHLAPSHASALAEILSRATIMPVTEVGDDAPVEPNHVYVIPPDRNLVIGGGTLQLIPRDRVGIHHPIDQFFRALADDQRHRAIGVVLSGTATDGTLGLEAIKAEGGLTFAQDQSAQHEGMPHSAIASGVVDFVLSPEEIAGELVRIAAHPYAEREVRAAPPTDEPNITQIVRLIYRATGVDFTHYKSNTLYRRITRRMVLQRMPRLTEYVRFLREAPGEAEALYRDILIGVTSFFRDGSAFDALASTVFPRLVNARSRNEPVRLWTLGCSTGEEAYSLAIAFTEYAEAVGQPARLQLFATDLNAASIETARAGIYANSIAPDVSPERLGRFFSAVDGRYRIDKAIRDSCIFSRHNVLSDPPFSRIDLISCRNLLIYLEPTLQQRVVATLHYALNSHGMLWLGASEAIGIQKNLFEVLDPKNKFFVKASGSRVSSGLFPLRSQGGRRDPFVPMVREANLASTLSKEADRILMAQFAPAGVLVSGGLEILQYRGDTRAYLAPAPGKATLGLPKMLREELLVPVQETIKRASKEQIAVRKEGLEVRANGGVLPVTVEVIPIRGSEEDNGGFLILFHASGSLASTESKPRAPELPIHADSRRLAEELSATRDFLQSVMEQQDATNEELQSANEEIQSANEELQSINEELETSKEEIQSSNEELATVNDELNNRNLELNRSNNDLLNLLSSAQIALAILGPDLRIRRFTPMAEKLLNIGPGDLDRPLTKLDLGLDPLPDLGSLLAEVLETVNSREREVRDKDGRWYSLRLRPYRTMDNRIDGVVVTLIDVDAMKRAEEMSERLAAIVTSSDDAIISTSVDGTIRSWNKAAERLFGYSHADAMEKSVRLLIPADRGDEESDILEHIRRGETVEHFETARQRKDGSLVDISLTVSPIRDSTGRVIGAAKIARDITEQKRAQELVRDAGARFEVLFEASPIGIFLVDSAFRIRLVNPVARPLFGDLEGLIGRGFDEVIHLLWTKGSADDIIARFHDTLRTGDPHINREPIERRGEGGTIEYYEWQIVRILLPAGGYGVVCHFRDVSVQEHARVAIAASERLLREADIQKNEFLAMLAHELRNPLAPIANILQVLQHPMSSGGGPAERASEISNSVPDPSVTAAYEMMERQVRQLVRLVDDLLDVSRVTRGRIELRLERVDLASVVHYSVEAARSLYEVMGHELSVTLPSEPLHLIADPTRLAQVLGNLLNNACKFTEKGGRVDLVVERDKEEAVIRVRDNGIGIDIQDRSHIFDMFTQVDTSLVRTQGGLGIGLTLVKRLVEMHDGTVAVESGGIGQGSEFIIRLLIAAPSSEQPAPAVCEPIMTTARRILVADDNRDSADSLAMLLKVLGNDTCTAYDGPKTLEAAAAYQPQVVLLDIGMPEMNGYEVARKIRTLPGGKEMVLVALTGWGREEDRQRTREAGFDGHLVKPVDLGVLGKLLAETESAAPPS